MAKHSLYKLQNLLYTKCQQTLDKAFWQTLLAKEETVRQAVLVRFEEIAAFSDGLDSLELGAGQESDLLIQALRRGPLSAGQAHQLADFLRKLKSCTGAFLETDEISFLLNAAPDLTEWHKNMDQFKHVQSRLLRDVSFTVPSEQYRSFEAAVLSLGTVPKTPPTFKNGLTKLSTKIQRYCQHSVFPPLKQLNSSLNGFLRSISQGRAVGTSENEGGILTEILPGISVMTTWHPSSQTEEYPFLLTTYLKERPTGVEACFLAHKVCWPSGTDAIVTQGLAKKKGTLGSDDPHRDKEKPPTELRQAFFEALRGLAEEVLQEGNTTGSIASLTQDNFTIAPVEGGQNGRPAAQKDYADTDAMDTAFGYLNHITRTVEYAKGKKVPGHDSLPSDITGIALNFLDAFKRQTKETWQEVMHSKLTESKSAEKIIVRTSNFSQEAFFDDKKHEITARRPVLQDTSRKLTTQELNLDLISQAMHFVRGNRKDATLTLGTGRDGKQVKSRFIDHNGTIRNGTLFLSSALVATTYRVTLGVQFPNGEKHTTQPFVYDSSRMDQIERFTNTLSLQLILLKTLYQRGRKQ